MSCGGELGASALAALQGVSRQTMAARMRRAHERHGPAVVGRVGKRGDYVTTREAWTNAEGPVANPCACARLVRELRAEVDELRHEVAALRRRM